MVQPCFERVKRPLTVPIQYPWKIIYIINWALPLGSFKFSVIIIVHQRILHHYTNLLKVYKEGAWIFFKDKINDLQHFIIMKLLKKLPCLVIYDQVELSTLLCLLKHYSEKETFYFSFSLAISIYWLLF